MNLFLIRIIKSLAKCEANSTVILNTLDLCLTEEESTSCFLYVGWFRYTSDHLFLDWILLFARIITSHGDTISSIYDVKTSTCRSSNRDAFE